MFFSLSKIFWIIFQPATFLALLMSLGLIFFKTRAGRGLLVVITSLFLIFGFLPIGNDLLCYLENQYSRPEPLPDKIDGAIVLGGAIDTKLSVARGEPQLNDNAERIIEMVRLSHLYPQAKIVFTGGDGTFFHNSSKESEILNNILKEIEFNQSHIMFEDQSRNTYENMIFSKELVHPQAGENWLLLTSAFHMPRSVAIFQSNGWPVIPYPAGYLTDGAYKLAPDPDLLGNYYKLQVAVKEIVGIIAYSLTERIKSDDQERNSLPSSAVSDAPASGAR